MKMMFVITLLLLSTFTTHAAPASRKGSSKGWRESYGGDFYAAEFKSYGRQIGYGLSAADFESLTSMDKDHFNNIVDNVQIECKSNLILDNVSKWAINYPFENPQRIELDCNKWTEETSYVGRLRLVAHEFLHLSLIDDSLYEISEKLVNKFLLENKKSESATLNALDAALFCQIKKFNRAVADGANIYTRNEDTGANLLNIALSGGCLPLLKELDRLGVKSSDDPSTLVSFFYFLKEQAYTKESEIKNMIEVTIFLATHSSLKTDQLETFEGMIPFDPFEQPNTSYKLKKSCIRGSTIATLLAKDFITFSNRPLVARELEVKTRKIFIYQALKDAGFNTALENECGESADKLML